MTKFRGFTPTRFHGDREKTLAWVKNTGYALYYAGDFQDDHEIVLTAIRRVGSFLRFASERLRNTRSVVLAAVQNGGIALEFASEQLKNTPEIVLNAVKNCGWALKYASERLKDDPEIVSTAVKQNPGAIKYASKRLQGGVNQITAEKKSRYRRITNVGHRTDEKFCKNY